MKASYINHLTKTFRFFLEFVRTVTLKLIYIRTCYDTYMHMCQAIFDSPIDRHNIINYINTFILYEVSVLDKHKDSLIVKW